MAHSPLHLSPPEQERLDLEHFKQYIDTLKLSFFSQPIILGLISFLLFFIETQYWHYWLVFSLLGLVIQIYLFSKYLPQQAKYLEYFRYKKKFQFIVLATGLLSGMSWGVLFYFLNFEQHLSGSLLLTIIILGILTVSTGSGNYSVFGFKCFSLSLYLSASLALIIADSPYTWSIIICLTIYWLYLLQFVFTINKNSIDNTITKIRNIHLAEQLAREKSKAESLALSRRNLLAATSHDLRQPLNAMNLFLSALNTDGSYADNQLIYDKLTESASGMSNLLDHVLELSKLDSDTISPKPQPIKLSELLSKIDNNYRAQAENKGLNFVIEQTECWVYVDPVMCERMLSNLLSNAIKYSHDGDVKIAIKEQNTESVTLLISDQGIGISQFDLENIFTEFYQAVDISNSHIDGLGLGLSIVKRLSELMSIPIQIDSELGKGTHFAVTLPINATSKAE